MRAFAFRSMRAHRSPSGRSRSDAASDRDGAGFDGNPEEDALYLNVTPSRNDGATTDGLFIDVNVVSADTVTGDPEQPIVGASRPRQQMHNRERLMGSRESRVRSSNSCDPNIIDLSGLCLRSRPKRFSPDLRL